MEKITGIVSIKDLKFPKKPRQPYLRYDRELDVFFILMVPPEIETVAYYVDSHVALLYISKNKEIVGFQVEDFERDFLPKHLSQQNAWKLSDVLQKDNQRPQNAGDIIFTIQEVKPRIVRGVQEAIKATVPSFVQHSKKFDEAFSQCLV